MIQFGIYILSMIAFFSNADDPYVRPIDKSTCPLLESVVFTIAKNTNADYVEYRLYTKLNPENYQIINNETDIHQTNYNPNHKTIFLVHGYRSSPDSYWGLYMKSGFLQKYDYNVIIVDWKYGANQFYAPYAIAHAYATGKEIAKTINLLVRETNTSLNRFHLIGFSLGGQVVAFAGKNLNKVGRITSLDPAGPCFIFFSPEHRIHHTDADFVDVIVTNAGGYSLARPVGHVYFYVNGGRAQKSCADDILSQIENRKHNELVLDGCSHNTAPQYFTESILAEQCLMIGHKCDDYYSFMSGDCADCGEDGKKCAIMGINADEYIPRMENNTQEFYLETNFDYPSCLFHYQVTVKTSNNENITQHGKLTLLFEGQDHNILKHLDKYFELFEPGGRYTYLITNSFDIDLSASVRFKWFRIRSEFSNNTNLFVDCIKVVKMNNLLRNRSNVTSSFRGENIPIPPGREIIFHRSNIDC